MQSSVLSSTALSPPRFSTSFSSSKRGQNTTRHQNKHNLRVYAKDFPKPEQIDKTENYRIAGDLSKRFAVRRPFTSFLMIKRERICLSFYLFFRFFVDDHARANCAVPFTPPRVWDVSSLVHFIQTWEDFWWDFFLQNGGKRRKILRASSMMRQLRLTPSTLRGQTTILRFLAKHY